MLTASKYNPETYSTDFDVADRLYFEELSYERVMDIYELEHAGSAVVSFGGQLPQNIALKLQEVGGARILGTNPLVCNALHSILSSFQFLGIRFLDVRYLEFTIRWIPIS